jgi:hypothetical protein
MKNPQHDNQSGQNRIRLSEVEEAQLRAWVDAGYMSPEEYRAEMERRRSQLSKDGACDFDCRALRCRFSVSR